jgi:serine/threonine protein phosphatase PrpC
LRARLHSGSATHAGRVRALNEDAVLSERPVFAVADGMGGHAAGEVASALAINAVRDLTLVSHALRPGDVTSAIAVANQLIVTFAQRHAGHNGMGTTLAGVAMVAVGGSDHWLVFNIGDSRVYRLVDGRLVQLSTDHSEVAELLHSGRITAAEAAVHPRRNVITRSLGTTPSPAVDTLVLPLESGQRFLLCSDGLTLELAEGEIAHVMSTEPDPQAAADRLVAAAVDAGGRDNVSAVVVDADAEPSSTSDLPTGPRSRLTDAAP